MLCEHFSLQAPVSDGKATTGEEEIRLYVEGKHL